MVERDHLADGPETEGLTETIGWLVTPVVLGDEVLLGSGANQAPLEGLLGQKSTEGGKTDG